LSADPIKKNKPIHVSPNPFTKTTGIENALFITFNLVEKGPVSVELIDMMGRVLVSEKPENVLNQTYAIQIPDLPSGAYVVRASSNNGIFTERVIIHK
jgi:hypothetical protein